MKKPKIVRDAERQARMVFKGIAIPMVVPVPDSRVIDGIDYVYGIQDRGRYVVSEKVVKFNRAALKNIGKRKVEKVDPRMIGSDDTMRFKVGKPGSRERVEALAVQYASLSEDEMSPFAFED